MTRKFTGRHMLLTMIGFFGVVISVNVVMAVEAGRTFGGTVVENSYVASQRYNRWLDEAHAQKARGWAAVVSAERGHAVVATRPGARLAATASHPLGRLPDRDLSFVEEAPGRYVSHQTLPAGRWRVHLDVRQGGESASFQQDVAL